MRSNQVQIDSPCHESWEAMDGDEERRFCGVCQKHVHNLSAMRHDEAKELLKQSAGDHLCVRYAAETDGTLRFRDLVPRGQLTRKLLRTAFAASMLAACTPHGDDAPRGLGEVLIESQQANVVATPDGGCNYTTGPFTTFHLPPGHALCQNAGPVEQAIVTPIEVPIVPEVPEMPMMGAIAMPAPPPQVVDPVPVPKMGEAIAMPEAKDPFVPCDPTPGYAPPPPPKPPTNGVRAAASGAAGAAVDGRMGDYSPEPEGHAAAAARAAGREDDGVDQPAPRRRRRREDGQDGAHRLTER
jgi:hypothetical protein